MQREWQYALSLGRAYFVRPTYWEHPLPSTPDQDLPPEELRRLHFSRLSGPMARIDEPRPSVEALPSPSIRPESEAEPLAMARSGRRGPMLGGLAALAATAAVAFALVGPSTTPTTTPPPLPSPMPTASDSPGPQPSPTSGTGLPQGHPPGPPVMILDRIPAAIAVTCHEEPPADNDVLGEGFREGVRCLPGLPGPDTVLYLRYDDLESLVQARAVFAGGDAYRPGDCSGPLQVLTYRTSESRGAVGALWCRRDERARLLVWTHRPLRILALAADSRLSFPELSAWWRTAGPYFSPDAQSESIPQ